MSDFNIDDPHTVDGVTQPTDLPGAQNPPPATIDPMTVTGQRDPTPTAATPSADPHAATNAVGVDWNALLKLAPQAANLINGAQAPGQLSAQAQSYTDQANKYGSILNPYGAYRDTAAQKLQALQADPSSIVNTPGYKFSLSQELGAVSNADNRRFGVGAGSTSPDQMNFAQGLASKTYNDTINQYSAQAGVPIGPQAAASIYQTGMLGNIAANQASNAARGANTTNALTTGASALSALAPGIASLAKIFQNSGMSPAQAIQMAHQVMGMPTTTTSTDPTDTANQGSNWDGSANPDPTLTDFTDTSGYIDPSTYDQNYG
jgi:hypothetical protein